MSKDLEVLESLERIKQSLTFVNHENEIITDYEEEFDIIEKSLQRLESIDNANLSEAMKCLEKIKDSFGCDMAYYGLNVDYEIVEQALIKAQEMEKTLKIVFEKKVNILLLELAENVDEYNERIVPNGKLTEEEFKLLKEWLKCLKN